MLAKLPADVMVRVLKELDAPNRLRVAATCKALRALVRSSPALWVSLYIAADLSNQPTVQRAKGQLAWLQSRAPTVQQLIVRLWTREHDAVGDTAARLWPSVFAALLACRESLCSLEMSCPGSVTVGTWLLGFPQLTALVLKCNTVVLGEGLALTPALQRLQLGEPTYWAGVTAQIATLPTRLTALCLKRCNLVAIPEAIYTLRCLEVLDLGHNDISRADFTPLAALTQLEELDLCWVEFSQIPTELALLTNLQRLYLAGCSAPAASYVALQPLHQLEELSLVDCGLDALPALSGLTSLSALSVLLNELHVWEPQPWLPLLHLLALDYDALRFFAPNGPLCQASSLRRLYITRASNSEGGPCDKRVLETLVNLPQLRLVRYIIWIDIKEDPNVLRFLLALIQGREDLVVEIYHWEDLEGCLEGMGF